MAPSVSHVQKLSNSKGGRYIGETSTDNIRFHDDHHHYDDTTTIVNEIIHETMSPEVTTMQNIITTIKETLSTLMPDQGGAQEMNNSSMIDQGGANENTNSTFDANSTFRGNGSGGIITTSTGTSLELITSTLTEGMHMEHTDEDEHNYLLFIILGVVLGILIIASIVLGVVYSHYKKRGFQEISPDHGSSVDPQSMKQLQQASSQDALLDK